MGCSCVYVDTDEALSFYTETSPTARKQHKCCECHRVINPKEKYEKIAGMWDGRFDTYKTCSDCTEIRNAFFCNGWIFEHVFEDLKYYIEDVAGEVSESCLADLTPGARSIVCEMIELCWTNDQN